MALVVLPLLCMAQDDLYFTSSKKAKQKAQKEAADMRARTSSDTAVENAHRIQSPVHAVVLPNHLVISCPNL